MVLSISLLPCASSVSVKENPDRKKKKNKTVLTKKYLEEFGSKSIF